MKVLLTALAATLLLAAAAIRSFDLPVPLETVSETTANASLGDLNGDGNLDIVLAKGRHWPLADVVFFGENVPRGRVDAAARHLEQADAVLIVGSSLMVYSGFRFVQMAASAGKPAAAVNLGRTRADELLALKVEQTCEAALAFLL